MKKQMYVIGRYTVIGLLLLVMNSCDEKVHHPDNSAEIDKYKKLVDSLERQVAELKEELGSVNDTKPKNIISPKQAQVFYDEYNSRARLIDKVTGKDGNGEPFEATRSLFYDINHLNNYLAYIQRISKEAKVEPTGYRFYFALYPDNYVRGKKDKSYAKRQTFFIAPTVAVKNEKTGELEQLGYSISNDFKVEILREKLGFESRIGGIFNNNINIQEAGFFNLNMAVQELNSTIGNEYTGSPPK